MRGEQKLLPPFANNFVAVEWQRSGLCNTRSVAGLSFYSKSSAYTPSLQLYYPETSLDKHITCTLGCILIAYFIIIIVVYIICLLTYSVLGKRCTIHCYVVIYKRKRNIQTLCQDLTAK